MNEWHKGSPTSSNEINIPYREHRKIIETVKAQSEMQPIVEHVWREKYRHGDEANRTATLNRVVDAVCIYEEPTWRERIRAATLQLRWCPAGRIVAGAGTGKRVTMINCYVSPTIQDSMETEWPTINKIEVRGLDQYGEPLSEIHSVRPTSNERGILDSLAVAALTQQQGGGIGMDFSTLRPAGALVSRTGSEASGPLPFMDMWNAMCATVMSSGSRRGAMMAVMRCDHPDIEAFITAKRTPGRLTNFNVSVLVTDLFMKAVEEDKDWHLTFDVPPTKKGFSKHDTHYTYKTMRARELWDLILRNTYEHAEPGVIFIDRINKLNNLNYCETIAATNPCGEQPLPPNGACCLGAVNLAAHVTAPFSDNPVFDHDALVETVRCGVRFLDNVHNVTRHPTREQQQEAANKRRIGLGITGLGNMLQALKTRYGSKAAITTTAVVMAEIAYAAYDESANLAKERGKFPLWNEHKFNKSFIMKFPEEIQAKIRNQGLRNGVLLTVAPTGTTSIFYDNISSGIEPTFSWAQNRKILQPDGSRKVYEAYDWGIMKWAEVNGKLDYSGAPIINDLPDYMVKAEELTIEDHLRMQAAVQKWVDASISKTINVPVETTFEKFQQVYALAYSMGLKGVTTYRPSKIRGSVLEDAGKKEKSDASKDQHLNRTDNITHSTIQSDHGVSVKRHRPEILPGKTYKVRWPHTEKAYYITINDGLDNKPFELFITGGDEQQRDWVQALARLTSALLRRGDSLEFVVDELEQIHSTTGGAYMGERFKHVPSAIALVGKVIREHMVRSLAKTEPLEAVLAAAEAEEKKIMKVMSYACKACGSLNVIKQQGCYECLDCNYTKCD